MNAPEVHVQHAQPMIALASIVASKTNPRKTFDPAKLEELTGSVKLKGVLQPILVRPVAKGFEIVAGERRFKAAKAAGLVEIPATVRQLTDAEALELQVIENNQREDLHPLEEAEGFEALMNCKHPDGTPYTVKDIASKVGKSPAYVYQKLKLCACSKDVRKAFYDGKIDFSKALLLARIHGDDLQRQALKEITFENQYSGSTMNFRQAQQHVQQRYMLSLDKAPFSTTDEKLVPKAGACTTCPKRTGNAPELFADVKSGDVCTDPACFSSKRVAVINIEKQDAIAAGREVLSGKAAKQVMPHEHGISSGYVTSSTRCYDDPKQRTYAEIVGPETKPIILENPHRDAELLEIYRLDDIKPILKEKGAIKPSRRVDTRSSTKKKKATSAAPQVDREALFRKRLFLELCAKMPSVLGKEELAALAANMVEFADDEDEIVADALLPTKDGKPRERWQASQALSAAIPKLDVGGLSRLIMALFYAEGVTYGDHRGRMAAAAKRWKVDPAKLRKALDAEAKVAKENEAAEKKKAAAAAKDSAELDKLKRKVAPKKKAKKS